MYVIQYRKVAMSVPVSFTELRRNLASHLDRVEADREELTVTRHGHEAVVVMPLSELEGLRETLHLLGNPVNAAHLLASIAQLDAGRGTERDLLPTP